MRKKDKASSLFVIVIVVFLAFLIVQGMQPASGLYWSSFDSPISTPLAPDPAPVPSVSKETQRVLKFVAGRENVPVEQLVVVNQYQRDYEMLGKSLWDVTLLDTQNDGAERWHRVMVDLADGSIVDDVEAIEQAERAAHHARYGKLEPALFERLETLKHGEEVPVVIWVAGGPKRNDAELYAELAAKYPEAQAGLERSGSPFDAGDLKLIHEIENEYVRMLQSDTQEQAQALARYLEEQGYAVEALSAMPAVAVTLPKDAILKLVNRTDVGAVDLDEDKAKKQLDSAVPGDRVPAVWRRGFEGNGVHIGILEPGKVDFTGSGPGGSNYLHQGAVRSCAMGADSHKTLVTSVAASYHSTYTGVAPEAIIDDACTDTSTADTIEGLAWAINRADPINFSATFNNDFGMNWTDKAFDYWARAGNDTIVVAVGEFGDVYVGSPGKGWNTLTVGGTDDKNTSAWADDHMWSDSRWDNPTDIEKPEVVAPGVGVKGIQLNSGFLVVNGTSVSAPQVTGLTALLIDRKSDLDAFPTAVKAIIMASAIHNIVGPSGIPTGQDLKDGAGAIDAAMADEVAKLRSFSSTTPCDGPCWWGVGINNTNFPGDSTLYRYFNASRGERIRVAIAWWSSVDCPDQNDCDYDRLDTNLHMGVQYKDGGTWHWAPNAWSASHYNSYELVDFTAPHTGQYRIVVDNASSPGTFSNQLGIAWVKDATHLPDLRNNSSGVSEIRVLNVGAEPRNVTIHYFNAGGKESDVCFLDPNQSCWIMVNELNRIPYGATGSAIVDGGEDVVAIARTERNNELTIYNGITGSNGTPGWEQTGSTLYVPVAKHNYYGRYSSIEVVNAGGASSTVTAYFYEHADGGSGSYRGYLRVSNLAPGARHTFQASGKCRSNHYCAVRLASNNGQPLAAVVREYDSSGGDPSSYNAVAAAANTAHVPIVKSSYYNESSGVAVMNASGNTASVTFTFYKLDGTVKKTHSLSVPARSVKAVYLPSVISGAFLGSAYVSANRPVVAVVAEEGQGFYKLTNAFSSATYNSYLPELFNYASGAKSGISVQNLHGSQSAHVCARYYNTSGTYLAGQDRCVNIPARAQHSWNYWNNGLPANFHGSAWVESTNGQPIAVVVTEMQSSNPGTDRTATFNGSNR